MSRCHRLLLLLCAGLPLLAGCDRDAADGSAVPQRVVLLTPQAASADTLAFFGLEPQVDEATQVGLLARNESGALVPSLAGSWRVSSDGRSYIFRLRDIEWSDGRQIDAGDVVAVFRRIMSPGSKHPLRDQLMMIENGAAVARNRRPPSALGVTDPRPDTVEIRLSQPYPELLQLLALPAMVIKRRDTPPPAAGPFDVRPATADRPLMLARRQREQGGFARFELVPARAPEDALDAFVRGRAQIVTGASVDGLQFALTQRLGDSLRLEPTFGVYGYVARSIDGPLSDVRVRRALAMSIDRGALVRREFGIPAMAPVAGLLPPTVAAGAANPDWSNWTLDARREEAQRLMEEAGYGLTRPLEIAVAAPDGAVHRRILERVALDWTLIGVRARISARDPAGHRRAVERGNFEMAVVERQAPASLPAFFLTPFSCRAAAGGYCNREADALLARAAGQPPALRRQLTYQAAKLLAEDAPLVPLFVPVRWSLVPNGIAGWTANAAGAHDLARLRPRKTGAFRS